MKVSSASKNNPNCIKSLKLNLFFMRTTPILFGMKVKPPCNTIAPWLQCIIFSFVLQCVFFFLRHPKLYFDTKSEYSCHAPSSCMAVATVYYAFRVNHARGTESKQTLLGSAA